MTYRETLFGSSELETVKLLKKDNFWRKVTETYKKPCFFYSWKHGGVIITCTLNENQSRVRSWNQVVSETKAWKKQETIKWKYSNAGKIQSFTFSALTKIHTYCLKILRSTGDHISLKLWIIRFDLRKKKELLQIRQQKTQFGNSEPQNVNLLNLGKFSKDCSTRKKRKPGKKWIQKAWMSGR